MGKTLKILLWILAIPAISMAAIIQIPLWIYGLRKDYGFIPLENGKKVRVSSWGWWWYRLIRSVPIRSNWCRDCHKKIDSATETDLCTCAFELDMKGVV